MQNRVAPYLDSYNIPAGNGLPRLTVSAFDNVSWLGSQATLRDPSLADSPEQVQARQNAADSGDIQSRIDKLRQEAIDLLNGKTLKDKATEIAGGLLSIAILSVLGVLLIAFGLWQVGKD